MQNTSKTASSDKSIIRKCHCCGQVLESKIETNKCMKCGKSFLPLNYFDKVHSEDRYKFDELFSCSSQLHEDDLIKGLFVLW